MIEIKWIECNLPWREDYEEISEDVASAFPKFPKEELNALSYKKFGITIDDLDNQDVMNDLDVKRELIQLEMKYDNISNLRDLLKLTDSHKLISLIKFKILKAEIQEFENSSEIYKKYSEELESERSRYKNVRPKKSFYPDLAKPGVLVELESGKQMLIGDINAAGGICDDCKGIKNTDIVKRYAIIIELKK